LGIHVHQGFALRWATGRTLGPPILNLHFAFFNFQFSFFIFHFSILNFQFSIFNLSLFS